MESYRKLVRDRIPELLDAKNVPYEKTIADPEEYKNELIKKLIEEVHEFAEAGVLEELADVLEVLEALKELPEYADVDRVRIEKARERGAFKNRIILKGEK